VGIVGRVNKWDFFPQSLYTSFSPYAMPPFGRGEFTSASDISDQSYWECGVFDSWLRLNCDHCGVKVEAVVKD
jgi:hypothetical protein